MWNALNAHNVILPSEKVKKNISWVSDINRSLLLGDLFGMFDDVLYCRLHFEMMTSYPGPGDPLDMCPPLHSPGGEYSLGEYIGCLLISWCAGELYPPGMPGPHPGMFVPGPGHPPGFPGPEHWPYGPGPDFGPIPDYQFNNNNDPIKKRRGRKKRKVDEFAAMNGYMEVCCILSTPLLHVKISSSMVF